MPAMGEDLDLQMVLETVELAGGWPNRPKSWSPQGLLEIEMGEGLLCGHLLLRRGRWHGARSIALLSAGGLHCQGRGRRRMWRRRWHHQALAHSAETGGWDRLEPGWEALS